MRGFVDAHSHVVPSYDDGARSIEEGLALCRAAYEAGTEILFATPHVHAAWDRYPLTSERRERYVAALAEMRGEAAAFGLDLRRGWEVFPSEVVGADVADLVLEGTRGVLVEFPGSWLDMDDALDVVAHACSRVHAAGLVAVLAHPERCGAVAAEPLVVQPLVDAGALLCVNAPSLVGAHGAAAEGAGWALVDAGLVALAASDGHSLSRPPALARPYAEVARRIGAAAARPIFDGSALPWL